MKTLLLVLLFAVPAHAGDALDCLKEAETCLGETTASASAVDQSGWKAIPRLNYTLPPPKGYRRVPTPTGWRDDEDGTASTGFFKGLDSGFKTVFAGITYPAVAGIEATGAPYKENFGTYAFFALGVVLSIPASIIGVVLGAPIGAAAGAIAEKVSPGATKDWFTF